MGPRPNDAKFSINGSERHFPAERDFSDVWSDYDELDPSQKKALELPNSSEGKLHRYLICSRWLPGFVPAFTTWRKSIPQSSWGIILTSLATPVDLIGFIDWLDVDCCTSIEKNPDAMSQLILPEATKSTLSSLIQHFTECVNQDTFDEDWRYSNNLIYVFHGSPGTGKRFVRHARLIATLVRLGVQS